MSAFNISSWESSPSTSVHSSQQSPFQVSESVGKSIFSNVVNNHSISSSTALKHNHFLNGGIALGTSMTGPDQKSLNGSGTCLSKDKTLILESMEGLLKRLAALQMPIIKPLSQVEASSCNYMRLERWKQTLKWVILICVIQHSEHKIDPFRQIPDCLLKTIVKQHKIWAVTLES